MKKLFTLYQDGRQIGINIPARSAAEAVKKADPLHKAKQDKFPITARKQGREIVY